MVACPYLTKEGIELNITRKITYLCTPTYYSLFVYLLRKARGSSCSCVHLQYMLTQTLLPSALCYNVQLYIYICNWDAFICGCTCHLLHLGHDEPHYWKLQSLPSLHLLTNVSWFADKFLQSQSKLTNFGKI